MSIGTVAVSLATPEDQLKNQPRGRCSACGVVMGVVGLKSMLHWQVVLEFHIRTWVETSSCHWPQHWGICHNIQLWSSEAQVDPTVNNISRLIKSQQRWINGLWTYGTQESFGLPPSLTLFDVVSIWVLENRLRKGNGKGSGGRDENHL